MLNITVKTMMAQPQLPTAVLMKKAQRQVERSGDEGQPAKIAGWLDRLDRQPLVPALWLISA
jgi:hypothetical protein